MKKKQKSGLMVLLLVLVLCVAGYLGIQAHNKQVQAQKDADEEASKVYLSSLGDVTKLSFTNSNGEFSFQLQDGVWQYLPDPDFPLNQDKLTTLVSSLKSLTAVRSFEPGDSLSSYGLDAPAVTLTASDSDGNSLTLLFGGASGSNNYAMAQGGSLIYTVSSTFVTDLDYQLNDLVQLETFPSLTEKSLDSVTITLNGKTLTLTKETETTEVTSSDTDASEASAQPESTTSYVWYAVSSDGTRTPVDALTPASGKSASDVMDGLKDALSYLSFQSCENYKADDNALAGYGLTSPAFLVKVSYTLTDGDGSTTDGTYLLTIGSQNTDGSAYYAVKDNSSAVNLLKADTMSAFTDAMGAFGS